MFNVRFYLCRIKYIKWVSLNTGLAESVPIRQNTQNSNVYEHIPGPAGKERTTQAVISGLS
jgi:hypothetical protein